MTPGSGFPERGPLLGLDISKMRIGIAVCDTDRLVVTPLLTLKRKGWLADVTQLRAIIEERCIVGLIIGYPLHLDGSSGPAAQSRRDIANNLANEVGLAIRLQDESLSSEAVRDARREGRLPKARRGEYDDHFAAAIILEDALAALNLLDREG